MSSETEIRSALRRWLAEAAGVPAEAIGDGSQLVAEGYITSVRVLDFVLMLEELSGRPVQAWQLRPGSFASIDAVYDVFFRGPQR